jgi:hypothetical protein
MNAYRAAHDGTQPGDPARAAQVILQVLAEDAPPRRLLLGTDAVTGALAAEANRTAETQKWAPLSRATDFPARELAGQESASGG